jgi:hypothetical protein
MREEDEIRRKDREKKMTEWLTRRGKIKRRGEEHHPRLKCRANNYCCTSLEFEAFSLGWY